MYLAKDLKKKYDFSKIDIPNQSSIKEKTGSELDLDKAYEYIKSKSENFTIENEYARNIDKLLAELITSNATIKAEIEEVSSISNENTSNDVQDKIQENVSGEKQKVLSEIEDIKSLITFSDGDDLIKLEKELEDLEGVIDYL